MLKSERVNQWLRDAHAMETQAEQLLSGQARRVARHPQLSARLAEHIGTTRHQRERLEECMVRRKISPSKIKDTAARFTATMQNLSGILVEDEIVKSAMAIYTFEQMAIASYLILEAAANADGDEDTARQCAQSCAEEEDFCAWLKQHLSEVTVYYLREQKTA
jgi:ferritin-like metal-binding protein YciE